MSVLVRRNSLPMSVLILCGRLNERFAAPRRFRKQPPVSIGFSPLNMVPSSNWPPPFRGAPGALDFCFYKPCATNLLRPKKCPRTWPKSGPKSKPDFRAKIGHATGEHRQLVFTRCVPFL